MKVDNLVKSAVILSIGIVIASVFIAHAASEMKSNERYVTVKGLAEREVKANKVIWPIAFNDVSNNLNSLYESIESKNKTIVDYLKKNGIKDSEINISSPSVFDRMAQSYVADNVTVRYQISQVITVTSTDVDKVMKLMSKQSEMLKLGIAVGSNYENRVQYLYTSLNDLKPEMIEEATKNARQVADKFAEDAECDLGSIKYANQGQFSITEGSNTPHIKQIRVVTTVDYFLK